MKQLSISHYIVILFCGFLFSCSKENQGTQTCMDCPLISSLGKTTARANDTIYINGSNFAESGNTVTFNEKVAKTMFESPTKIIAYVPANCGKGPVVVQRPDQIGRASCRERVCLYV